MPEFEETNSQPDPSHTYTPSTDALDKPRRPRRSGGFKTEVSSSGPADIGEVNSTDVLKPEKLSGSSQHKPTETAGAPEEAAEVGQESSPREPIDRKERPQREPRAPREREEREELAPREPRAQRAPREPREERITNPQPSAETLAAIKCVEANMAERRTERDTRRKERDKKSPERSERPVRNKERKPAADRAPRKNAPAKAAKKSGLLAAISGFFGKLFGAKKPEKKPTNKRSGQNRDGRPQNRGGNRGEQNRRPSGNRGGQGRRQSGTRGGQGRRQGGSDKRHTATSRSNES